MHLLGSDHLDHRAGSPRTDQGLYAGELDVLLKKGFFNVVVGSIHTEAVFVRFPIIKKLVVHR
jgi:hypothetical protein